ncbi:Epoxide hydrolase domain protein [Mycena kentingensis (nom. inval.)]|nr:Epoxide hydrolase domain protein [Mycena kentingensis (nom. inval.)]
MFLLTLLFSIPASALLVAGVYCQSGFNVTPFTIDLSAQFAQLKDKVNASRLPEVELYPGNGQDKGVPLEALRAWKEEWVSGYDWEEEQARLNSCVAVQPEIEGLKIHFIHQRSKIKDSVPLILLHGWPGWFSTFPTLKLTSVLLGSFHEFLPIIAPLTEQNSSTGVSFHVVVPSLPGFIFSSPPKTQNWTVADTARVFNTLMTDVLGYDKYAVHGTDWVRALGSAIGYTMYTTFNPTGNILGGSFDFLPFSFVSRAEIASDNITLSPEQQITLARMEEWEATGNDYYRMLTHKPSDLGYALYDNPVAQLAFIGGKYLLWSQPPPSPLYTTNNSTLLTAVSLYALTDSAVSAGWIYAANPTAFGMDFAYPGPGSVEDAPPMVFSHFPFNIALWPEEYVRKVGKVVAYRVHTCGGHFAGLDNPSGLVEDIRLLAEFF